ncbi:BatD family protein [Aromatoleum diolicum]|nr:BatD family protein [Aromatoleum diolicum]
MKPGLQRPLRRLRMLAAALTVGTLLSLGDIASAEAQTNTTSPAQTNNNPKLWLEAAFEPDSPYVQSQGVYTLRLYQAISVRDLQFHAPAALLADIRPIGADRITEATRHGHRYRVTERRYAVFPVASGELALSGAHVTGLAALPGPSQALRIAAPSTPFAVRPIPPAAGTSAWLPARTLTLSETWSPDPSEARPGEALRRTIRIEAHGLTAAQLPALAPEGTGFSAHPEAPRLGNRFDDAWNVGTREQTWLIVPTRPGPLTLPALQVHWWDVRAHQPRTANLSARALTVVAAATDAAPPIEPTGSSTLSATTPPPAPDAPPAHTPRIYKATTTAALSALALTAAVAALGYFLRQRRRRTATLRQLKTACRHNDPHAARDALLRWSVERWPANPPRCLGELGRRMADAALQTAVAELERHLYGPDASTWDSHALHIGRNSLKSASTRRDDDLPPLYSNQGATASLKHFGLNSKHML